jgi:3-hydroxyacyl-CoA dehydrogenase
MMVAVGYAMLDKGVSTASDIETAAVEGLGYGQGPFALSRRIGLARTIHLLERLQTLTGDARFRVPFNLRQVAAMERLGKRWE